MLKTEALRATRRANLRVALEAYRVIRRDLGTKMGWSDGSFIGQLVRGRRPITEELARQLEDALRGMAHPIDPGDLDLPTHQFQLKHPGGQDGKRQLSPAAKAAEATAGALSVLAEELRSRQVQLTPDEVAALAREVSEAARKVGHLNKAQVRHILADRED